MQSYTFFWHVLQIKIFCQNTHVAHLCFTNPNPQDKTLYYYDW